MWPWPPTCICNIIISDSNDLVNRHWKKKENINSKFWGQHERTRVCAYKNLADEENNRCDSMLSDWTIKNTSITFVEKIRTHTHTQSYILFPLTHSKVSQEGKLAWWHNFAVIIFGVQGRTSFSSCIFFEMNSILNKDAFLTTYVNKIPSVDSNINVNSFHSQSAPLPMSKVVVY